MRGGFTTVVVVKNLALANLGSAMSEVEFVARAYSKLKSVLGF
jgi:hypothetical protein